MTEWQKRHLEFQQRKLERERQQQEEAKQSLRGNEAASPSEPEVMTSAPMDEQDPGVSKEVSPGFLKALPVFIIAGLVLVLSLLMISPWSKTKQFVVEGLVHTSREELLAKTGIPEDAYISQVARHPEVYEKAIVDQLPWVKSAQLTYAFPNRFTIKVEEYGIVAYNWTDAGYAPILESGEQVPPLAGHDLPEGALPLQLTNPKDTALFIKQFVALDPEVRQSVKEVALANSQSTPDLLLLTMAEGHTVRVPLSELGRKLPYYKTIKNKLGFPQIIDMEVGIYTTTPELESLASETKASKEQESREYEALYGTSSSSVTNSSTTTRTETSSSSRDAD